MPPPPVRHNILGPKAMEAQDIGPIGGKASIRRDGAEPRAPAFFEVDVHTGPSSASFSESVHSALIERIRQRPGTPRGAVVILNLLKILGPTPAMRVQELAALSDRTMERAEYQLLDLEALDVYIDLDPQTRRKRKMYALRVPAELAVAI